MIHVKVGLCIGSPSRGTLFRFDFDLGPGPKYVLGCIADQDRKVSKNSNHTSRRDRPVPVAGAVPTCKHIALSAPFEGTVEDSFACGTLILVENLEVQWRDSKRRKLLFSTVLVFHVPLFCDQFTHSTWTLQVCGT